MHIGNTEWKHRMETQNGNRQFPSVYEEGQTPYLFPPYFERGLIINVWTLNILNFVRGLRIVAGGVDVNIGGGSTVHLLGEGFVKDGLIGDLELGAHIAAVRLGVAAAAGVVEVEFGLVEDFFTITAPVGFSTTILLGLVGDFNVGRVLAKVAREGVPSGKLILGHPMRRIIGFVRAGHGWN